MAKNVKKSFFAPNPVGRADFPYLYMGFHCPKQPRSCCSPAVPAHTFTFIGLFTPHVRVTWQRHIRLTVFARNSKREHEGILHFEFRAQTVIQMRRCQLTCTWGVNSPIATKLKEIEKFHVQPRESQLNLLFNGLSRLFYCVTLVRVFLSFKKLWFSNKKVEISILPSIS